MNANELRIANYIKGINSPYESYTEVDLDLFVGLYNETVNEDDLTPIILTEQWLLNLGFEYYKPLDHYRIVINDIWYSIKINHNLLVGFWFTFVNLNWDETKEMPYKKVDYVHELQNLFFALTNKELTIINE